MALTGYATATDTAPRLIFYQGRLANDTGSGVNGTYSMQFDLYDVGSGGSSLFSQTVSSVSVQNGIFSVYIGDSSNIDTLFNRPMWLKVSVGGTAFSPYTPFAAVPYAIMSYNLVNAYLDTRGSFSLLDTFAVGNVKGDSFIVKRSGNVGVGTSTPGSKFDVKGSANVQDTFAVGGTRGDSLLVLSNGVVLIDSATLPNGASGVRLFVRGNVMAQGNDGYDATGDRGQIYAGDTNTHMDGVYGTGLAFSAYNAQDSWIMQESTGNFGVGITVPVWRLHLLHGKGNGLFVGTDASWSSGDTAAAFFGDGNCLIYNDWNSDFIIQANKEIDIMPTTRVGINTTSPTLKLEVNGGIKSDSIVTANVITYIRIAHSKTGTGWGAGYGNLSSSWFRINPSDFCPPGGSCQYKISASWGTITASSNIDVQILNTSNGNEVVLNYLNFASNESEMNDAWTSYTYNGEATFFAQISVSNASTDWTLNNIGIFVRMNQ